MSPVTRPLGLFEHGMFELKIVRTNLLTFSISLPFTYYERVIAGLVSDVPASRKLQMPISLGGSSQALLSHS